MDKVQALLPPILASGKPAIIAALGDDFPIPPEFIAAFRGNGIPVLRSPERAMRALAHATAYAGRLEARENNAEPISAPDLPRRGTLAEYEGKACLVSLGVGIPRGALVRDVAQAKEIAARIGYPVVLKAQAAALAHKSDAGGVALNIADATALEAAWRCVTESVAARQPGLALDGMLVEEMAPRGVELIVGARRDPQWGPVLMVGLGGIWTEALDDVRLMPADLPREGIIAELGRLKGARLLRGLRGSAPVDIAAVADVAARVGGLMRARPEISEIDINPLVAYPHGVLALDALIVCA
jgi:acyl-CoA synthetase (NDP forming)